MAENSDNGVEKPNPTRIPYWRMVIDQAGITPEVESYPYPGSGTEEDPYVVSWIPNDPRNPMLFSTSYKWFITMLIALITMVVALVSSAYSGGVSEITASFGIGDEVATLGISLFVLGFAIGPLMWAPMSEMFGRQILFTSTYALLTAFNAGCAGAQNSWTLIILRFFAGSFGSSPLTNAGGVIADMFPASQRGLAMSFYAAAPFLGPVLGPIIGGFLGENAGWRWIMGLLAALSGTLWILGSLLVPETYAPVLLRRRAAKLSQMNGKVYTTRVDLERGKITISHAFKTALSRPWLLLLREPIVFLLSVYMAIIYGTLYMLFSAYPIVYQETRGWSQGVGSLPFLGVMVGMLIAVAYSIYDNKRYQKAESDNGGFAPPEARLPPCIIASFTIPVGLFWFAWTNSPSIQFMASIVAGAPFGFGVVLVFLAIMNYLIDAYTIYAASVLAANAVLRSLFGAAFPLFTTYMYANLGIHWASSVPAFLAVGCIPFPILFYKYGARIRAKCKYAAESLAFIQRLQANAKEAEAAPEEEEVEKENFDRDEAPPPHDISSDSDGEGDAERPQSRAQRVHSRASTRTAGSTRNIRDDYEGNPYDIDRVNTKDSDFSLRRKSAA
ncbi:hypothetical protein UA08_00915 [Talaromyces atroroseus]|uniref:Major facilitator superfamily (MFS) profile domain-containing protein n=1 Tax=Talaromyces atroroseus TaxID=1441469 RepID=A0A225BAA3_TALAT|nr:hypothetical protein UA08_00915 [Talaromyces atroroseus]OKL64306.1 hypothetical protein UA08_00915 [Talaromyces atroroseus]